MKDLRFGYVLQIAAVVAVILFIGGHELPKYGNRLTLIAVLTAIDMIYWLSVRKAFMPRFKKVLTIAYWLPLYMLLLFFISGFISPYPQWPSFLRVYFPGMVLILMIGKGIFLTLLIASDFFIIPLNLIKRIDPENIGKPGGWYRPRSFLLTGATISFVVMFIYILGMFLWVGNYKLHTVELSIRNLPVAFDGYKMVHISDMHLGTFVSDRPLKRIIKIVNDQKADVILYTGDIVNFNTYEAYPFEQEMKGFEAKDGIYTVLGNHDYGEYTTWESQEAKDTNNKDLLGFYNRIGWQLLMNKSVTIKKDSVSIAVIGVENWSANKRFGKKGDLEKAISGTDSSQFKVLLTHDPSHWDGEVNNLYTDIDLTLAGHTHAMQFAIERGSIKWSPASLIFKQWGGLYEKIHENGVIQYLYVNRGLGTLGYPGRIATRPEITLIILHKAD